MTAENELSLCSSSWNGSDSNKPILHRINRDPSFDIYGMAELYMYMQEILDIPSKHETLGQALGQRWFTVEPAS